MGIINHHPSLQKHCQGPDEFNSDSMCDLILVMELKRNKDQMMKIKHQALHQVIPHLTLHLILRVEVHLRQDHQIHHLLHPQVRRVMLMNQNRREGRKGRIANEDRTLQYKHRLILVSYSFVLTYISNLFMENWS